MFASAAGEKCCMINRILTTLNKISPTQFEKSVLFLLCHHVSLKCQQRVITQTSGFLASSNRVTVTQPGNSTQSHHRVIGSRALKSNTEANINFVVSWMIPDAGCRPMMTSLWPHFSDSLYLVSFQHLLLPQLFIISLLFCSTWKCIHILFQFFFFIHF